MTMWIEELSNGKYKYVERYYNPLYGKTKKVSITLSKNTAQARKHAEKELAKRINKQLNTPSSNNRCYSEIYGEWLAYYKYTVKPNTLRRCTQNFKILNKHIDGDILIDKITSTYIEDILIKLNYESNYSKSTIKQMISHLKMLFRYCQKRKYVKYSPLADFEFRFRPEEQKSMGESYLTKDETKKLLSYLYDHHQRYAYITELLLLTGTRFNELLSLTAEDYTGKSIIIKDAKTKTGKRTVLLNERSIQILNQLIEENNLMAIQSKYLIPTMKGNKIDNPNYNRYLQKASQHVGITKHVTAHLLRHTHITLLIEAGVDIRTIMHRVGHAKPETTLKIYAHITQQMNETLLETLNNSAPFLPLYKDK
ncbi:site-specific integrase [Dolosigranulum pigrum]|nr:site-specific integrase [Dolosigranulum pigrum]